MNYSLVGAGADSGTVRRGTRIPGFIDGGASDGRAFVVRASLGSIAVKAIDGGACEGRRGSVRFYSGLSIGIFAVAM